LGFEIMKENQEVNLIKKGIPFLGVIAFILGFSAVVRHKLIQNDVDLALRGSSSLAEQLAGGGIQVLPEKIDEKLGGGRKPSSILGRRATEEALEGKIGIDPWGAPYSYRIIKSSSRGQKAVIVVWSSGPNQIKETTENAIQAMAGSKILSFVGDDLGVVRELIE